MAKTATSRELHDILIQAHMEYKNVRGGSDSMLIVIEVDPADALRAPLTTADGKVVMCIKDAQLKRVRIDEEGDTRVCLALRVEKT